MPKRLILPALILTMTGCQSPVPAPALVLSPLPLPARPALPLIAGTELACLSAGVYQRLAERQRRLRQYAETLETIIRSTRDDHERTGIAAQPAAHE